jgi:aspartyl-tRNA(Asn)/glutamyl-tRNA(Gln) amidotransferase subunit C
MKKILSITRDLVKTIKTLSRLKIDDKEEIFLTRQFNETLTVVDKLGEIETKGVKPTNQVTGLNNVFRKDLIDKDRILSQKEALGGSKNTHGGFFVVKAILNEK